MTYQTGAYTSPLDLLTTLRTFAVARGWTLNTSSGQGGDPSGNQVSLQSDGHVVNIIPDHANTRLRAQPSTAWINNTTNFEDHTGSPNTGGLMSTTVQMSLFTAGAGVAYHLFGNNAGPRYIHLIAETSASRFSHFSFGTITKVGTWTGGGYVTGSAFSTTNSTQMWPAFGYDANVTNGTQWMRVDNLVGLGSPGWRQEWGSLALFDVGQPMVDNLWKCGLDTQTQRSLLAPVYCVAKTNEASTPGQCVFLGTVPDVRLVSLQGRLPGEVLTIGADDWHVFPLREKATPVSDSVAYSFAGSAPNFVSNYLGIAYRET